VCDLCWVQTIANLEQLTNLTELWLGKNKFTEITGVATLTKLARLDIQVPPSFVEKVLVISLVF
jgi:Leucine-rich repeat (LRR) protein